MKNNEERKNRRGVGAALGLLIALLFLVAALPANVVAENQAPMATLWVSDTNPLLGEEVTFDASGSIDFDGTIVMYFFNFGDGTVYNETESYAPDGTFDGITTHTYTELPDYPPEPYWAGVTVYDNEWASDSMPAEVFVNDVPVANFLITAIYAGDMGIAVTGEQVWFDCYDQFFGQGSWDYWGITACHWEFEGDDNDDGYIVDRIFTTAGTHNVTLTATDYYGVTDDITKQMVISQNLDPVAVMYVSPPLPDIDEEATFDASTSYDQDMGIGAVWSYSWDFGDSSSYTETVSWTCYPHDIGCSPVVDAPDGAFDGETTHTYTAEDTYTVTLTVTDNAGGSDITITDLDIGGVPNTPPVADFSFVPIDPEVDETVTFYGSSSYDPDMDGYIVSYEWDFGDGSPLAYGSTVQHSYDAADTYTVTLTVEDNLGATDTDIQYVEVSEVSQSTDIFVYSIDFTEVYVRNKIMRLDTTVKITDDDYTGIQGAEVYGTLTGPGSLSDNYQGTTAADGTVTFEYEYFDSKGRLKPVPAGTYTFTVTSVVKTDWTYNAVKDLDNPDSFVV